MNEENARIAEIERRLSALEEEKRLLSAQLDVLRQEKGQQAPVSGNPSISLDPITPDRIKLFMGLFRGRQDVFPKR